MIAALCAIGSIFSYNFATFNVLFALEGMSFALLSGATTVLLKEASENVSSSADQGDEFLQILSFSNASSSLALTVAIAVGGFFQILGWWAVFGAYALACIIASILVFNARSIKHLQHEDSLNFRSPIEMATEVALVLTRSNLKYLLVAMALIVGLLTPLYVYSQAFFEKSGLSTKAIAIIYSATQLTSSFIYLASPWMEKKFGLTTIGVVVSTMCALCCVFLYSSSIYGSIIAFFLLMTIPDILDPIVDSHFISSSSEGFRTTLLSVVSFCNGLSITCFYFLFGLMLNDSLYYVVGMISALMFLFCGGIFLLCTALKLNRKGG